MKTFPLAVGVVLFQGDTVLLVRHENGAGHVTGTYGLPAGRLNPGETELQAAVRELQEETGLVTLEDQLASYPDNTYTGTFERKGIGMVTASLTVLICRSFTGALKNSSETTPEWVKIDGLSKLNLLPNIEKAVHEARQYV